MHYSAINARQQILRRNQNTTRYQPITLGMGPISHAIFMALIVAITGMIYLTQITKTSSFGYQVDKLKNARQDLIEENQALEVEAARLQTLDRIKSSDIAKKLESSNGVHFTY